MNDPMRITYRLGSFRALVKLHPCILKDRNNLLIVSTKGLSRIGWYEGREGFRVYICNFR